ncbi:MAG: hypothetical protein AVDCRST_MAG38-2721 [uncultured Solirubrobacteraceae bacterium]|uniref:Uncharacterized protein n=1 Tax=uncultured Solirubrobacteraceae bacterium TaxID=1162706 RepID=A0A6J4SHF3_9ACTN|nr:MAG: hypothetical protein AVDCRST_MAG38-2721 [uncultured Solirubrobacteraceae bacterium]
MTRTRSVLVASGVLAVGISGLAGAATNEALREGVRNGTATRETQIISNNGATNGPTGGFATRQSNKSSTGGGAIYGCRANSARSSEPCLRANNLSSGKAFEFSATTGAVAGSIDFQDGGDDKKPLTTNATGVATGLNADRVDGQSASEIAASAKTRWLLVNGAGQIESQSGGFTVLDAYVTNANVYINAGEDLTDNGITATLATANQGVTPAQGSSGEVTASRCQIPGVVECAPANAKNVNAFVVTPRNSDGTATDGSAANPRKRFYVQITEE